jgi:hypothetical protein
VHTAVAGTAKCNQVLLDILAAEAAKFFVVNFKVRHRATELASPSVTPQHALPQLVILFRLSRKRGAFNPMRFTMLSFRLLAAETHASGHRAGI